MAKSKQGTTITPVPQDFAIVERGGAASKYSGVRRQVRRRLEEIDAQIAQLKEKKAALLMSETD